MMNSTTFPDLELDGHHCPYLTLCSKDALEVTDIVQPILRETNEGVYKRAHALTRNRIPMP